MQTKRTLRLIDMLKVVPFALLLVLLVSTGTNAFSPTNQITNPEVIATSAHVSPSSGGLKPGCRPANGTQHSHPSTYKRTGPTIVQAWRSDGSLPWGDALVKFYIPSGTTVTVRNAKGYDWDFADNAPCRYNSKVLYNHHTPGDGITLRRARQVGLIR